jgi:hypothetical protein
MNVDVRQPHRGPPSLGGVVNASDWAFVQAQPRFRSIALRCSSGMRHFARDPLADALEPELNRSRPRASWFLRAESFYNIAARIDAERLIGISAVEDNAT